MTDPIADMLTRIRNGTMARHERVEMPHSNLKERVAIVMKGEGYLDDVRASEGEDPKVLTLILRYGRDRHRRSTAYVASRPRAVGSTCDTTASRAYAREWEFQFSARAEA